MQHHPAIGRADAGFLTDLVGLEAEKLAHHEYARRLLRQMIEAGLEHAPELLLFERSLRISPATRRCAGLPVAARIEQRFGQQIVAFLVISQTYRKLFKKGLPTRESDKAPRLSFSFSPLNNTAGGRSISAVYELNRRLEAVGSVNQNGSFRGLLYYLIRFR